MRAVRHLCLQKLFCRQLTQEGKLAIHEKRSEKMTADLLTKVVPSFVMERLLRLLFIE